MGLLVEIPVPQVPKGSRGRSRGMGKEGRVYDNLSRKGTEKLAWLSMERGE